MAKIIISRSGGKKEYEVSNDQAHRISDAVDVARKSGIAKLIKFEHLEFMSSDYRGAEYDKETKVDNAMTLKAKEWHDKRRMFAQKSAEEKTEHFMNQGFKLLSSIVDMSIDERDMIQERVLLFFQSNPLRCYPDGSVFKHKWENKRLSAWEQAKLRTLELVIHEDQKAVESDKRYNKSVADMTSMGQGELNRELDKIF